jgi:hypothetical protein
VVGALGLGGPADFRSCRDERSDIVNEGLAVPQY